MTKKPLISVSQLFCMLFISRMVVNLTYNPLLSGGDSMWDHIVSARDFLCADLCSVHSNLLAVQPAARPESD